MRHRNSVSLSSLAVRSPKVPTLGRAFNLLNLEATCPLEGRGNPSTEAMSNGGEPSGTDALQV